MACTFAGSCAPPRSRTRTGSTSAPSALKCWRPISAQRRKTSSPSGAEAVGRTATRGRARPVAASSSRSIAARAGVNSPDPTSAMAPFIGAESSPNGVGAERDPPGHDHAACQGPNSCSSASRSAPLARQPRTTHRPRMPTGHAPIRAGRLGRGRFSPTISRVPSPPAAQLVAALRGVRALLLDIDGVLVLRGRQIPGAAGALAAVERAGVPYRLATNTSAISRTTLAAHLARAGLDIPIERIVSAASATAAHVARRHPGGRIFLISTTAPPARAFRLLRAGAGFVAMHKNRWWLTKRGVTLDSGGLVVGLEYATERRATGGGQATKGLFL